MPSPSCQARTTAAASTDAAPLAWPGAAVARGAAKVSSKRTASGVPSTPVTDVTDSRGCSVTDGLTMPAASPDRSPRHRLSLSTKRGASAPV